MLKVSIRTLALAAGVVVGSLVSGAYASIYTVSGDYDITLTQPTGSGTFSFEVNGTYDQNVDFLTVVGPVTVTTTSGTDPFAFVGGETINTGPVANTNPTNYIFNQPGLNFDLNFPDAFNGSIQTGGTGTTYANGEYATLSDVTISVPEPASLSGLAIGGIALLARRRRALR